MRCGTPNWARGSVGGSTAVANKTKHQPPVSPLAIAINAPRLISNVVDSWCHGGGITGTLLRSSREALGNPDNPREDAGLIAERDYRYGLQAAGVLRLGAEHCQEAHLAEEVPC